MDKEFSFLWFMVSLYHDLAYFYEKCEFGEKDIINSYDIQDNCMGVPLLYKNIYKDYNQYRDKKEGDKDDHGILGGLYFDRDICKIRNLHSELKNKEKNWEKGLIKVYHYVAWCILSHSFWFYRLKQDEAIPLNYKDHLQSLLLKDKGTGKSPNLH